MDATAIYVVYRTETLDCGWIPDSAPIIVVHNDRTLDRDALSHDRITHLDSPTNIGFGAAVNRALALAATERVVVCNPDTVLTTEHWLGLHGASHEVVTVPLVDDRGVATSVVAPYWTPLALAGATLRLGARLAPLGSRRRRLISTHTRGWLGQQDRDLCDVGTGADGGTESVPDRFWPLDQRWVSGAVMSIDRRRMLSVGGFDPRYFLYFEDADLCRRLALRYPNMTARMAATPAGRHTVGAAGAGSVSPSVERLRRRAAVTYGSSQDGFGWWPYRLLDSLLSLPAREWSPASSTGT